MEKMAVTRWPGDSRPGLHLQATCTDSDNDKDFCDSSKSIEGTSVASDYFSLSQTAVAGMTVAVILDYLGDHRMACTPHALRLSWPVG